MAKKKFQIWWTDDRGNRIQQLKKFAFLNYTRIVNGIGTLNIGLPFSEFGNIFREDYRVEVWRTPKLGQKRRLENTFSMQEGIIRARQEDGVTILDMTGHDPNGMLDRRIEKFRSTTSQATKTNNVDNMMKEIVDEQMGAAALADDADRAIPFNEGFFRIQADSSLGASITKSFAFRNIKDILKELHQTSRINTPRIYFDIIPVTPTIWEFQTFKDLRGADRRFSAGKSSFLFSLDRGNLELPSYEVDSFEYKNVIYVAGQGKATARAVEEREAVQTASLWGRREMFRDARQEETIAGLQAVGDEELGFHRRKQRFIANFLDTPNSVYGKDWDLGNWHTVSFAGIQFDVEIKVVYVTLEDTGEENIFGRNEFGEF